jgi:anti-anti-sigma regulatory factor
MTALSAPSPSPLSDPSSAPSGADYPDPTVLELAGPFGAEQASALQLKLIDAVGQAPGDLYLDVHGVTAFDDDALNTLTAARSRAKSHRTRIAVLDDPEGVVASGLRRTGRHFRFPIYPDAAAATTAMSAEREARDVRSLGLPSPSSGADRPNPLTLVANPDRNLVD